MTFSDKKKKGLIEAFQMRDGMSLAISQVISQSKKGRTKVIAEECQGCGQQGLAQIRK